MCGAAGHKANVCRSNNVKQQNSTIPNGVNKNSTHNAIGGSEHFEYLVDATLAREKVSCLLDSGAGDTFMSFDLYKRLFPFSEYAHTKEGETLRAANSSTMRICGALRTTVDFGPFRVSMKLTLLEDLFYDVVLSINFFDEYVASIRPADLKMQMRDGSIVSFWRSGIKKASMGTLVCTETVTILPYSKSTLPFRVIQATPNSQYPCVSYTTPLAESYGVVIPYCVFGPEAVFAHI